MINLLENNLLELQGAYLFGPPYKTATAEKLNQAKLL